jgi:hypothetical protein
LDFASFAVDGFGHLDALRHAPVVVSRFVSRFAELIKLSYSALTLSSTSAKRSIRLITPYYVHGPRIQGR